MHHGHVRYEVHFCSKLNPCFSIDQTNFAFMMHKCDAHKLCISLLLSLLYVVQLLHHDSVN